MNLIFRRARAQRIFVTTARTAAQAIEAGTDPQQVGVYIDAQCRRLNRLGYRVEDHRLKRLTHA